MSESPPRRLPFLEAIAARRAAAGTALCVGLDPDPARIPAAFGSGVEGVRRFLLAALDATRDDAVAYKPNSAFFEALGAPGWALLAEVIAAARRHAPVVLDAKRGDIGNTAGFYARAAFDSLGADALTLNPLLGGDSIAPFLEREDRGLFLLCATSNPGADDFLIPGGFPGRVIAARAEWARRHPAVGLVVGATRPELLADLAARAPDAPLLVPGLGPQGGELDGVARLARAHRAPVLVNVTRAVLYPDPNGDAPPTAAEAAAAMHGAARAWRDLLALAPPPPAA